MPDITMCKDKMCPLHASCYRFQATPNPYAQSYFTNLRYDKYKQCDYYWPMNQEVDDGETKWPQD